MIRRIINPSGFALPTVIISSIILLMVLVTAISATVAIRNGLQDQYYTELASAAAEAGTTYAKACINQNGGQVTWTDAKPLKPNTDCNGNAVGGRSAYVFERSDVRSYFEVSQPMIGASNLPISAAVKGYSEVLRSSSGVAWRVWSSDTAVALVAPNDGTPVGTSIEGYWSTPPAGYLLEDGSCVSSVTYANLFAVIGSAYGSGCGSNQFRLPNSKGRDTVAMDSTVSQFDTMGETGGATTHTLTAAQIPKHTHDIQDGNAANYLSQGGSTYGVQYSTIQSGNCSSCGGQSHPILDPYIVVLRVIKY